MTAQPSTQRRLSIWSRPIAVAAASLALAAGGLTATAPSASAEPTSCTTGSNFLGIVWAKCTAGTGEFRVVSGCYIFPAGAYDYVRGGWTRTGGTSNAWCFGSPSNIWVETRG